MSRRVASCPGCGAELEFRNAATLWVACPWCGSASTRSDLDLKQLGKVAAVAPIPSPFALGQRRQLDGRWITFIGQRQLDHGAGPWNEWYVTGDDGKDGWIAEARGELLHMRPLPEGVDLPSREALSPGTVVRLGPGEYTVAERGKGRVVAAAGEFPRAERVGERFPYVDLRGPGKAVATIDYGGDEPVGYQGRVCDPEDLGLTPEEFAALAPKKAGAERLGCPQCGGQVDLKDPASVRIGCLSCGSLLDTTKGTLEVLHAFQRLRVKPVLPLGGVGKLRGKRYEVRAMLERSVTAEGIRYPWQEFLLVDETGGQRWLTRSGNHWSFVEPVGLGDVRLSGGRATWKGKSYKHFQGGTAVLDFVLGELPWEARIGDRSVTSDYVAPPEMISLEQTGEERIVTLCTWIPPEEVRTAFALERPLSTPRGVAPNQPNRWAEARRFYVRAFVLLAAVLIAFIVVNQFRGRRAKVFEGEFTADKSKHGSEIPPEGTETDEAQGRVVISDEFELTATTNLRVELETQVDNDWLGVDGALVDLDTGEVRAFALLSEYYHGVDGGESWTEGSRTAQAFLGPLQPGRYVLRLEPATAPGVGFRAYTVRATEGVPSKWRPLLLLLFLAVPPGLAMVAHAGIEASRWQNSDHAS